jgi:hypothetical protein
MGVSVLLARSHFVGVSFFCGSLSCGGCLFLSSSLLCYGRLGFAGSLLSNGWLLACGSLICYGRLVSTDSLIRCGCLVLIGSLPLLGRLWIRDSLVYGGWLFGMWLALIVRIFLCRMARSIEVADALPTWLAHGFRMSREQ